MPRTAWAEIDLDALAGNLAVLRRLAGDGTPLYPVVKADAYGHGAIPVAQSLEAAGVDGFCVATFDEAVALREAGVTRVILVLYSIPPGLAAAAADRSIAVTAGDATLLAELLVGITGRAGAPLDVHLEVETGLGRGGFRGPQLIEAATAIEHASGARLVSAWTHFQAPEDADRTSAQVAEFERATQALAAHGHGLPRHMVATGGLLLGDVLSLDGVRPGLATYGLMPDELLGDADRRPVLGPPADLRPVLSLHARPVRVADLPAGWGISYGPTFTTARPSRIATLPLGYGDGWPRSLSNRAEAIVRGRRVPIVGNVAMDAVMADVTDVPGAPITPHDEFVLIGSQGEEVISAADLAAARRTNSWEVVTSLAARLPRVYHAASVPRQTRTLTGDAVPNASEGAVEEGRRRSVAS